MQLPDGRFRKRRRNHNDLGHAHELTFSCYRRLPLLSKDRSRLWLIDALKAARAQWCFELWAYVIMPEHVHVLLLPLQENYDIGVIKKSIKQRVAQQAIRFLQQSAPDCLNVLRVREGQRQFYRFWQTGGGYDRNITIPKTAWSSVDYIHNNPVRRGLVSTPRDWAYSSARWYAGDDDVLLAMDDCPPNLT